MTVNAMVHAEARGAPSSITRLTCGLARCDEEAFREFHALYFDRLFRYHIVVARGDEHVAKDALQETLLRVVRHARRFDNEEAFWCWLTVLARSAAADLGRKRGRYWKLLARYASSLVNGQENTAPQEPDRNLEVCLDKSIAELDAETRTLVEGKYFRRASVRELAAEMGVTEKAVESRLLRARRELRENILKRLSHEDKS